MRNTPLRRPSSSPDKGSSRMSQLLAKEEELKVLFPNTRVTLR